MNKVKSAPRESSNGADTDPPRASDESSLGAPGHSRSKSRKGKEKQKQAEDAEY